MLWRLVEGRPTEDQFSTRLRKLSDDDTRLLALQYMNSRYALMQAIWEHGEDGGASEDVIEDLVDWLILGGADTLTATLSGKPPLPQRETWGELEEHSLFNVLCQEVKRRFKANIYDLTGHDYPYPWTTTSDFVHADYLAHTKH